MPIDYTIHHDHRLVVAHVRGAVSDTEIFAFQREVWSREDVQGFDELVDTTEVVEIALPSTGRVRDLAAFSATMDVPSPASPTKIAIVAPQAFAFGIARMYEAHREADPAGMKRVAVFRTREAALAYLGRDRLPEPAEGA